MSEVDEARAEHASPAAGGSLARRVADLRDAAPAWATLPVADRVSVLDRWREQLRTRGPELVEALGRDTGRTALSQLELDATLSNIDRCARWATRLLGESDRETAGVRLCDLPVPLGLVGVVAPWNFPLQLALIDAVPALAAGCVVLVKPSELTGRFVPILRETVAAAGLADVLGIVEGGPEIGRGVVDRVDTVCFTGSVGTGRQVAEAAARRFIPAFLELGGKDPAIVTASADLDVASSAILWGATANTGQSCMSIERVYVHERVAEEFTARLLDKAPRVSLALPGPGDGDLGPFIDPTQADVVEAHIADAVDRGATVRCGGVIERHGDARYLRPTVLTGVDHTMRVMTEETFGPVIPVMTVADAEQAVTAANDTDYGLSAAVFGAEAEAQAVAGRLEAGGISVNDVCLTGLVPEGEKQAFKLSGLGPSRMGPAAVSRFLRKRVMLTRVDPRIQPWWY